MQTEIVKKEILAIFIRRWYNETQIEKAPQKCQERGEMVFIIFLFSFILLQFIVCSNPLQRYSTFSTVLQ